MNKKRVGAVFGVLIVMVCLIGIAWAAWQDRTELTAEPTYADDEFMIKDESDTTDHAVGTVKRMKLKYLGYQKKSETKSFSFALNEPTAADDFLLGKIPVPITLTEISGVLESGTNFVGGLEICTSAGASCSNVDSDITFDGGEDKDDGALSDPTVAANERLKWHTTSVSSPGRVEVTIFYTIDFSP